MCHLCSRIDVRLNYPPHPTPPPHCGSIYIYILQARQAIRPHYGVLCALYVTVDPTRWRVRWFALALLRHRAPVGCLPRLLRRAVAFEQRTDANRSKYEPTCTSSCLEPPLFDCRFFPYATANCGIHSAALSLPMVVFSSILILRRYVGRSCCF